MPPSSDSELNAMDLLSSSSADEGKSVTDLKTDKLLATQKVFSTQKSKESQLTKT